jgi:hypothetical protein
MLRSAFHFAVLFPTLVLLAVTGVARVSSADDEKTDSSAIAAKLPAPAEREVDFARDIQPLLARCTSCHGIENQESGLNLQDKAKALAGGDSGKVIIPGKSDKSRLVIAISGVDPDFAMPPEGEGKRLTAEQVGLVRAWIDQGAKWPDPSGANDGKHWAYQKPIRHEPPAVKNTSWPKNAIDHFVLARLEEENLHPSAEVDRARLIRRVSLDLIGLPPTVEEVDAFLADTSPDAYDKVVDRLLGSPHYGERWARPWLDLARYADTHGYEKDPRRSIWPYRDWVINALNADMPYDQFTIEQLAGDLLPNPTLEQRIATGFHRNTMINTEGGVDQEEYRVVAVVDRVNTTATVWLGTTLACAQCHSHKYDPFTQKEYYQLFAFFNSNADSSTSESGEMLPLPNPEQQKALDEIKALEAVKVESEELKGVKGQLAEAKKKLLAEVPKTLVMKDLPQPRETHVMVRGNFLSLAEKVTPGVPAVLHALPADERPKNRLTLARWLVSPENPLTARVAANRMWEQFFGRGLVETSEDFGTRGTPPSHPELFDWLATEFIARRWSMKQMHRLIVTSATYRQTAVASAEMLERDPYNRLLARGPRSRLEAEMVRDHALAVAGLLSRKTGGPSVMPPQPDGLWNSPYSGEKWQTSTGDDKYRRGLYTFWKRTSPYPSFMSFDAPSREFCVVRRPRTNTPLQALTTLNDPVYVEAAQALAKRMIKEGGQDPTARATRGFRIVLARMPQPAEIQRLAALYQSEAEHYRNDTKAAEAFIGGSQKDFDTPELAAWTVVANVLLNLDEAMSK